MSDHSEGNKAQPAPAPLHEANLQVAAAQLHELLQAIDLEALKAIVGSDLAAYSRIVVLVARLSEVGLKYDRCQEETVAVAGGETESTGVSPGFMFSMEEDLKLL